MQPFIPAPNVAKFEFIYLQDNQVIENVFHIKKTGGWNAASLDSTAADLRSYWETTFKLVMSDSVQLTMVRATDLTTQFSPGVEHTTNLPLTGSVSGSDPLPNNVSIVVKWTTGLRGRSYRGRTYHIGLVENQIDGNRAEPSFWVTLRGYYNGFISRANGNGALVVVSRWENKVLRTECVSTPIIAAVLDPTVDSQRRRLPGRGR